MEDYVKVETIDNEIESQIISDILTERDIPFVIRTYHDEAYGNLFQISKGWGKLYAPEDYKQEIKQIIEEIRNTEIDPIE